MFSDVVEGAEKFRIHFPNSDDESKNVGKEEFTGLANTQTGKSEYYSKGTTIIGDVTPEVKNIFYKYFTKAYGGDQKNSLKYFELYNDEDKIFEIQDSRVGYLLCSFYSLDDKVALGLDNHEKFVL